MPSTTTKTPFLIVSFLKLFLKHSLANGLALYKLLSIQISPGSKVIAYELIFFSLETFERFESIFTRSITSDERDNPVVI